MRKLLREPLIHFLILGAALFLVFDLTRETGGRANAGSSSRPTWWSSSPPSSRVPGCAPPAPSELDGLVERYEVVMEIDAGGEPRPAGASPSTAATAPTGKEGCWVGSHRARLEWPDITQLEEPTGENDPLV
jgi:hypothetical protein